MKPRRKLKLSSKTRKLWEIQSRARAALSAAWRYSYLPYTGLTGTRFIE